MQLTEKKRAELLALSKSESLRRDMAQVAGTRHNPFIVDGEVNCDLVVPSLRLLKGT